MNKLVKDLKNFKLFCKKYKKIGRRAKNLKRYKLEDGRVANYLEFDNIGLEFIIGESSTLMRDLKNNLELHDISRFEDYSKCFKVMVGYAQTHRKEYK